MTKFRVQCQSYINGKYRHAGDIIDVPADTKDDRLLRIEWDPLDHDHDGRKGGSLPKPRPSAAPSLALLGMK